MSYGEGVEYEGMEMERRRAGHERDEEDRGER